MADHLPAHRAIVVLVVDAATAAREVGLQRDNHVGVLVAEVFAVDDPPAWCGLAFEAAAGVHVSLLAHGMRTTTERTWPQRCGSGNSPGRDVPGLDEPTLPG